MQNASLTAMLKRHEKMEQTNMVMQDTQLNKKCSEDPKVTFNFLLCIVNGFLESVISYELRQL